MTKTMYDSLSMGVHLELLIFDDNVCLKAWVPINEEAYDETAVVQATPARSLTFGSGHPEYMSFINEATGVYHKYLPNGNIYGQKIKGEEFIPNIPASIRGDYNHLTGTFWQNRSYAVIDPTDPSINTGEQSDVACWGVGVGADLVLKPFFNTLSDTAVTKAHPLRSLRHSGSPASLMLYQPFQADKFTDCSVTFKYNKGSGFSTNVDGWTAGSGYDYLGEMATAFPTFTITSGGTTIDADATDTVDFKMVDADGALIEKDTTVYLESTGGYLPKSRVDVVAGLGSFKVTALGLVAAEAFKVKLGFRNYTGVKDVNYTVE